MSHLVEEYAKSCGVYVGEPIIKEHFYPVLHDKYITVHTDAKDQARSYSHWEIVLQLLKKPLSENNIKIIQIGGKESKRLPFIDQKITNCSYKNTFYIIKRSILHLGINSMPAHVASVYNKKIVNVFSNIYPECARPYWSDQRDVINISPDFSNTKPSFSNTEIKKRIDEIKPEEISNAVLDLLKIEERTSYKSVFFGKSYKSKIIDIIPNNTKGVSGKHVNIRMDKYYNLEQMSVIIEHNKSEITTNKPIPKNHLKNKNIICVNYVSDTFDKDFLSNLKDFGIKTVLLCNEKEKINKERARFFDYKIYLFDKNKETKDNAKKIGEINWNEINVTSSRKILSNDKLYSSYYEISKNKNDLFLDMNWVMLYYSTHE